MLVTLERLMNCRRPRRESYCIVALPKLGAHGVPAEEVVAYHVTERVAFRRNHSEAGTDKIRQPHRFG